MSLMDLLHGNSDESEFPTLEEFQDIVSDILDEFPQGFFKELSGGVIVEPATVMSNMAVANDLYTLGTYNVGRLGRQIKINYGSFRQLFPGLNGKDLEDKVREVVRHEFRHHWEYLSGMHGRDSLEAEDRDAIRRYLASHGY